MNKQHRAAAFALATALVTLIGCKDHSPGPNPAVVVTAKASAVPTSARTSTPTDAVFTAVGKPGAFSLEDLKISRTPENLSIFSSHFTAPGTPGAVNVWVVTDNLSNPARQVANYGTDQARNSANGTIPGLAGTHTYFVFATFDYSGGSLSSSIYQVTLTQNGPG